MNHCYYASDFQNMLKRISKSVAYSKLWVADFAILVLVDSVDHVLNLTILNVARQMLQNKPKIWLAMIVIAWQHPSHFISSGGMHPSSSLLNTLKVSLYPGSGLKVWLVVVLWGGSGVRQTNNLVTPTWVELGCDKNKSCDQCKCKARLTNLSIS